MEDKESGRRGKEIGRAKKFSEILCSFESCNVIKERQIATEQN